MIARILALLVMAAVTACATPPPQPKTILLRIERAPELKGKRLTFTIYQGKPENRYNKNKIKNGLQQRNSTQEYEKSPRRQNYAGPEAGI